MADDGVHGTELWSMPLARIGAARVQPFGIGCPGAFGSPTLAPVAAPIPGSATFGFELGGVQPTTLVAFAFGEDDAGIALAGCELLLGGSIATVLTVASASGRAGVALPLPAGSQFTGYRFTAQGFALDATTARGFSASDGEIVIVGR